VGQIAQPGGAVNVNGRPRVVSAVSQLDLAGMQPDRGERFCAGSPETAWVGVSGTGDGGGVETAGSASADGAVIMNAVITPSAHNPADPVRVISETVTVAQAVARTSVCVQSRHILWYPAVHQ